MELSTIGREIYPNMEVLMKCFMDEKFSEEVNGNNGFGLVLIEKGAGILNIGGKRIVFSSPSIICINETDDPVLERSENIVAKSIYFHPKEINDSFNFINLRDSNTNFSPTEIKDRNFLAPFFRRTEAYSGYMEIGLLVSKRFSQLIEAMNSELIDQRDWYWPCRSRSYFIELLIYIERVFMLPKEKEDVLLQDTPCEIDNILLYLHLNYDKKITISDLSKTFNTNRTSLNKQFNIVTKMPIMTYLIAHRIKLASMILRDTMVPINEIVERVGFNDVTNFTRTFRKHTQSTPSEYRQKHCWVGR